MLFFVSPSLQSPENKLILGQTARAMEFYEGMSRSSRGSATIREALDLRAMQVSNARQTNPRATEYRSFQFDRGSVWFSLDSDVVRSANFSGPVGESLSASGSFPIRAITDGTAEAITGRAYRLAGNEGEVAVWAIQEDQGPTGTDLKVDFVPAGNGVPYQREYSGRLEIDQITGWLHTYSTPTTRSELPSPPTEVVPRISSDRADDLALLAAVPEGGWLARSARMETYLCIWTPPVPQPGRTLSLSPEDRARAKRMQGQLVYSVDLDDRTSDSYSRGRFQRGFRIFLDAEDGRILSIDRFPLTGGGTSAATIVAPLPRWPSAPAMWRIADATEVRWSGPLRATMTPVEKAEFVPTKRVLLRTGEIAVRAELDPRRGLVGVRTRAGTSLARPAPNLLSALRRLSVDRGE